MDTKKWKCLESFVRVKARFLCSPRKISSIDFASSIRGKFPTHINLFTYDKHYTMLLPLINATVYCYYLISLFPHVNLTFVVQLFFPFTRFSVSSWKTFLSYDRRWLYQKVSLQTTKNERHRSSWGQMQALYAELCNETNEPASDSEDIHSFIHSVTSIN